MDRNLRRQWGRHRLRDRSKGEDHEYDDNPSDGESRFLAVVLVMAPLSAATADNDVGCGVGTEIWKGKSGLPFKLMASSTNAMLFQSVSITFGLLNCTDGTGTVTASAQARHFAATSFDNIARDMALGGGESLDTLSTLLEVDDLDRPAFAQLAQSHFDELFPNEHVTSNQMLETLDLLMQRDERLSSRS